MIVPVGEITQRQKLLVTSSSADESREALGGELELFQTRYRKGLTITVIVVTDQRLNFLFHYRRRVMQLDINSR